MRTALRQHQSLLTVLILGAGLGWIWLSAAPEASIASSRPPLARQGFSAPDFSLTSLDGATIRLADLRGKVVILNFWASWCNPCRTEMPAIERAYQQYQSQNITVLAVNATQQDDPTRVRAFVADLKLTFPVLLDERGETMALYQVAALPTTFFIDAQGVIQEVVIGGPMAEALLTSRIEQLLGGR